MRFLCLLFVQCLLAYPAMAQEYREFVGAGGVINWSNGTVSATGNGLAPPGSNPKVAGLLACRAAVVDAQRNLLEATEGVRVTSTTLVKDYVLSSDEVRTTVEGQVQGALMLDRKVDDDGVCSVVLRVGLDGDMSRSLYRNTYGTAGNAGWWMMDSTMWTASADFGQQVVRQLSLAGGWLLGAPAHAASDWQSAYEDLSRRLGAIEQRLQSEPTAAQVEVQRELLPTGLVVDARGSNFIPSLSPNIRQLRGGVIYPRKRAQDSILGDGKLVALFARSVEFAMGHPRVGERPLLVKGLRTWGDTRTEIVLGKEAAGRVTALAETDFFAQAGVVIVLD